jgi:hypothetical protein
MSKKRATSQISKSQILSRLSPTIVQPAGGQRAYHTYGRLFYTPRSSLALLALLKRAIPWTTIESQAAVVATRMV